MNNFQHVFTSSNELGVGCMIDIRMIRSSSQKAEVKTEGKSKWEHDYVSTFENPYSSANPFTVIAEQKKKIEELQRENRLLTRRCTYYR